MNSAPSPLGQINSGQELYTSAQTGQLQPEIWNVNCIELDEPSLDIDLIKRLILK